MQKETYGPTQEMYEIFIEENPNGNGINLFINGEKTIVDCFEFSAPRGIGLEVKKITRIELVPIK